MKGPAKPGLPCFLASGFWLIASERFDPHTAKKRYGHIAAAGTLGGLLSALATERVAAISLNRRFRVSLLNLKRAVEDHAAEVAAG